MVLEVVDLVYCYLVCCFGLGVEYVGYFWIF